MLKFSNTKTNRHPRVGGDLNKNIKNTQKWDGAKLKIWKMKDPCVYILASQLNGTLYIGVTSNLLKRIYEHKNHVVPGFTEKYGVGRLVYFEQYGDMLSAIAREKALKKWNRAWKIRLIESQNPTWKDLYEDIV